MKKRVLLGSLVLLSSYVFAEASIASIYAEEDTSTTYIGIGMSATSTRDSAADLSFFSEKEGQDRLGNLTLIAGYNVNSYIAVEGRYTTTFTDEDLVEMNGLSIFVKPQYPFNKEFSIYGLFGYGMVMMDSVKESLTDVDENGFQWGVGLSYEVDKNMAIFVDYTSLASKMKGLYYNGATEVDADAITAGVSYKF